MNVAALLSSVEPILAALRRKAVVLPVLLAAAAVGASPADPLEVPVGPPAGLEAAALGLTIAHVNDTHLRMESRTARVRLSLEDGTAPVTAEVEIGGPSRLEEALERIRRREEHVAFLHGGDFFRSAWDFERAATDTDVELWNRLGLDAAVLGNHEFDRGPGFLADHLASRAEFPLLSANVDVSAEPALAGFEQIRPYVIRVYGAQRVGIVGLTLPETATMSRPGDRVRIEPGWPAVQRAVDTLRAQGVNKIILLSHQGFVTDCLMAPWLSGVDVIVGGHSHSLLGTFEGFGWFTWAEYPKRLRTRDGEPVLVVQAGRWGDVLGVLSVEFDGEGVIQSFDGHARALAGDSYFALRLPGWGTARRRTVECRFAEDGSLSMTTPPAARRAAGLGASTDALRQLLGQTIDALHENEGVMIVHDRRLAGEQLAFFAHTLDADEVLRLTAVGGADLPPAP